MEGSEFTYVCVICVLKLCITSISVLPRCILRSLACDNIGRFCDIFVFLFILSSGRHREVLMIKKLRSCTDSSVLHPAVLACSSVTGAVCECGFASSSASCSFLACKLCPGLVCSRSYTLRPGERCGSVCCELVCMFIIICIIAAMGSCGCAA